jgi:hypothetical protein
MQFSPRVSLETMATIRERCLELEDMSHDARAALLAKEFPKVQLGTLADYSRIALGCTEKVWRQYLNGKISPSVLQEICAWERGDQDFIVEEIIEKKIGSKALRKIKRNRKEGWSIAESIAEALGEIPKGQPRNKSGGPKKLDDLLSEIGDKGARWRAMVTQAMELVGNEEAAAGVHEALFRQVFVLREVIGNQYDFVNSRLNRYMNLIRKRLETNS